ncbi:hypothetical protein [Chitinimonas sp. JJ19]|uniref:hypothetical protein n=1 Tax=Chitinimonas sp. JJ19 TaxID=3109352 RepID=UPI001A5C3686|nr:hypothetical protein [Chitinimonas sp.]
MLHRLALLLAAAIALFGAVIHFVAPLFGPGWYAFFGAPPQVVASAVAGSWLAPVSTLAIGGLMLLAGLYAFSAAGVMRRLPLTGAALWVLAVLCTLRGFILVPVWLWAPQLLTTFEVVAALVWLVAGLGYIAGVLVARRPPQPA